VGHFETGAGFAAIHCPFRSLVGSHGVSNSKASSCVVENVASLRDPGCFEADASSRRGVRGAAGRKQMCRVCVIPPRSAQSPSIWLGLVFRRQSFAGPRDFSR
jgi:hypothetical protein